jgi:hypothetical protein
VARTLTLAAPFAAAAIPLSAAPVEILSAVCGLDTTGGLPSDPSNCAGSASEGHVTKYTQYFSNGFTMSMFANGTAWTSGNQGGAFTLDAEVPVSVKIDGPSRNLVVYRDVSQSETLETNPGTIGQIFYGFNHFTVISRSPDGGDPISFDFNYTAPTSLETWTSDAVSSHSFGLSMQMTGSITAGALFGSMSESETFRFYEADGVTPVSLLAQTPEPASLFLLLGGIPACYLISRRRRSTAEVRN